MSRIEEALRRAGAGAIPASPESLERPTTAAGQGELDRFPAGRVPRAPTPAGPGRVVSGVKATPQPLADRLRPLGEKVVTSRDAGPHLIEAFRRLAATLCEAQGDRQATVLMVTSALAGEGKTLTTANLALTLSESFKQSVLIIDADLRRPAMHQVFAASNDTGLADALADEAQPTKPRAIRLSPTLTLLPAGRTGVDPTAVLSSSEMKALIEDALKEFTWVILDTPPIALLSDARLLATTVDSAVLVVQAERTPFDAVQIAIGEIGRERIIGVVLNQAKALDSRLEYGAYQYGHGHGAKDPGVVRRSAK